MNDHLDIYDDETQSNINWRRGVREDMKRGFAEEYYDYACVLLCRIKGLYKGDRVSHHKPPVGLGRGARRKLW